MSENKELIREIKNNMLKKRSDVFNGVIYEVNIRNYTEEGTIQAFEKHLSRLKILGVDILWIMPIHPISVKNRIGKLGSWYSISDFRAINPDLGTELDFKNLVKKAHKMGFKVIMDWVANHTGWDHVWIEEHPDWYNHDEQGHIISPKEFNWTDVADLDFNNAELRHEMIQIMKYWVKQCHIDGFRADYASGVPKDFWEEARQEIDKIKPVFMLAEDDLVIGLLDKAFDSNYSWELLRTLNNIAKGDGDAEKIKIIFEQNEKKYPKHKYPMYYTSNHDENTWVGSIPQRLGNAANSLNTIVFTAPGIPLMDSGQEIGLNRSLNFFDKDCIEWGNWQNNATHRFYEKLVKLKKTNSALWHDDLNNISFIHNSNDKDILTYVRKKDHNTVIVIVNLTDQDQDVQVLYQELKGEYFNYFEEHDVKIDKQENLHLLPWDYKIFIKN